MSTAADPPMPTASGAEANALGCRLAIEKAWTRARARQYSKALTQVRLTNSAQRQCGSPCFNTDARALASAGFADGSETGWEWGCLHGALKTLALLQNRVPSIADHAAEVCSWLLLLCRVYSLRPCSLAAGLHSPNRQMLAWHMRAAVATGSVRKQGLHCS